MQLLQKKSRKAALRAEERMPASDKETPRKLNKAKSKVQDGIDIEMKKIEDRIWKKSGDMAKPISSQQAGEEWSGTPGPQTPSQVQGEEGVEENGGDRTHTRVNNWTSQPRCHRVAHVGLGSLGETCLVESLSLSR